MGLPTTAPTNSHSLYLPIIFSCCHSLTVSPALVLFSRGKKLQNSPLLIACIFHWMWHSHLFFLLTFRLIIHALLYFIWTVIFHFFQWDTELINLLWNLSCHTWLPPSIYICTYICKIMQCGSNFARITAAESCPVWPCSVHRWFTASYKYADIKIQEETVNPMEQGRQETSSDDQRI